MLWGPIDGVEQQGRIDRVEWKGRTRGLTGRVERRVGTWGDWGERGGSGGERERSGGGWVEQGGAGGERGKSGGGGERGAGRKLGLCEKKNVSGGLEWSW